MISSNVGIVRIRRADPKKYGCSTCSGGVCLCAASCCMQPQNWYIVEFNNEKNASWSRADKALVKGLQNVVKNSETQKWVPECQLAHRCPLLLAKQKIKTDTDFTWTLA
jgi:hypothetical protein